MKKIVILSIIVLSILVSFSSLVAAETDTLELWYYVAPGSHPIPEIIEKWNNMDRGFEIEPRHLPFEDFKRELSQSIVTGATPDIILLDNPDHASFAAMGALADITDEVSEWGMEDKYYEGPWNSTVYNDINYGIPDNSNTIALFYNKDLYEKAGINEPPETWEELKRYSKDLSNLESENVRGIAFSAIRSEEGTFQFLPFLQMAGADIYSLNSDEAINALTLWTDLYKNGWASPEVITYQQTEAMGAFASGNTAMAITGPWDLFQLEDVDFDWGLTLLPYNEDVGKEERSSALGGENYAIMQNSEYREEAWEFIKWTQNEDILNNMLIPNGRIPSRKDIALSSDSWQNEAMDLFLEQLTYAQPRGPHPNWPEISHEIQMAIQKSLTEQATPGESLLEAYENINEITQ